MIVDSLIEELWRDRPPTSARTTLQTYIYHLRKLFRPEWGDNIALPRQTELLTRPSGYELRLGPDDELDVEVFTRRVAQAKAKRDDGLLEDAGQLLRSALSLWTGPALADVETGPLLSAEAIRLNESRRAALELRLEIDLQLGLQHELISELTSLVKAEPAHEGFVTKLMVALVRSGRRVEALEVYRSFRSQLVAEYGLEPSLETQRLHQAILSNDADFALESRPVTRSSTTVSGAPAQLPPAIGDFVGREAELARVTALFGLRDAHGNPSPASYPDSISYADAVTPAGPRVVEILGSPGVGKTTFAVQVAQRLRPLFPDGQFYEHAGESGEWPGSAATVLSRMLRACGVPRDRLPSGVQELSSMFRTWTADRRVLVVVTDAVSAAQVRALQPAGPGCAMLVTSRMRLTGLAGAVTVALPSLTTEEGIALLRTVVGAHRVDAEPEAAGRLVDLCEHLPLALRGVASRLASRPHWSLDYAVGRFATADDRLAELGAEGMDLVASVEASCDRLAETVRQPYIEIATRGMSTVSPATVARLAGVQPSRAETILEHLVDAHLVVECFNGNGLYDRTRGESAYRLPALLSAAARQSAEQRVRT